MRLLPVAAISAAVLAYEVLLMRLFQVVQWHHFAYMIISIALLGFGASGTFLALARHRLEPRFAGAFATLAGLAGVTMVAGFALAERLPFNPLAIVWEPRQLLYLLAAYTLLVPPFFCGGACVGLALAHYRGETGRVYAYDLIGAGAGALGIVALLFAVFPTTALHLVGALGLLAAALALLQAETGAARWSAAALAAVALAAPLWLPPSWTALQISQYKGLSTALDVPDAAVIEERSSPLGLLSVVESPTIPFRHAPGLSLDNTTEPPPQLGVFTDADGLSVITRFDGDLAPLDYLDHTTSALPYHLLARPKVLVLGAGGGADVLQAVHHDAEEIDAVEVDPHVIDLVADEFAGFAGGLYDRPEVEVHLAEARSFVAGAGERYDLVQLPLLDSFGAAAAGTHSLHESYIYTVEAFADYLDALRPGGLLAITRWLKLPPRDALKLFATATRALERRGVAEPGEHLALIRGWRTTTLLVKNGALAPADVDAIRTFANERSFDLAWYPGITADETNRFNVLDAPFFYDGASGLTGPQRGDYLERYKFSIAPATDDRPYFFDFFKWGALPELLALRTQGTAAMLDWGYLILVATLAQAAVLGGALILLPLWLRRRSFGGAAPRGRIAFYFLALGLAFLFVEIAFIQRFILFLGHPLYAIAVVLAGFLVFAGLGSAAAQRLGNRTQGRTGRRGDRLALLATRAGPIRLAVAMIAMTALLYLVALPPAFAALIALPDAIKVVIALGLIAPLAFFMGMPFPLGLARVAEEGADLVAWAWGINGCASVLSAILAAILSIHLGFGVVIVLAVALYVAAAFSLGAPRRQVAGL